MYFKYPDQYTNWQIHWRIVDECTVKYTDEHTDWWIQYKSIMIALCNTLMNTLIDEYSTNQSWLHCAIHWWVHRLITVFLEAPQRPVQPLFSRAVRARETRASFLKSVNVIALIFGTSTPSTATFFPRGARTGDARFAPLPPRAPAAAGEILQSQLYIYTYIYM